MTPSLDENRKNWIHYLTLVRGVLGVACLLVYLIRSPFRSALVTSAILLFVASSLVAIRRKPKMDGRFGLFALGSDTLFLILLARYGAVETNWLAPAFYTYLLTGVVVIYGPREVLAIAGSCVIYAIVANPDPQLRETFLVGATCAAAFTFLKSHLERRVHELQDKIEQMQGATEAARESECQRIAADFHDGPLQSMISFQMRLEILRKLLVRNLNTGLEELQQLQEMSKAQVREMRTFVRNMRPLDVDGASLTAATRRLVDEFQKESGIAVTFTGGDRTFSAAPETCTDVLQMIREALSNVQKHAKATRVAVGLERNGKNLEISIDDNGRGFHFSGMYTLEELELLRLGPVSLKRRARSLGAEMVLESRPGRGAGLRMKVPV